jgi:gas vesicle protein
MNRYQNGKIYKIVGQNNDIYIGSTIQKLNDRFYLHKSDFRKYKLGKNIRGTSTFELFEKYGIENCRIELIENYPCESKRDLERREGEIIKTTKCINKVVAGRTGKEYREDNAEMLKEKFKEFYNKNRESQKERVHQYYAQNADKVKERAKAYAKENKEHIRERKKKWREENQELVKEQKRLWREQNRDKINARKRELRALKKA